MNTLNNLYTKLTEGGPGSGKKGHTTPEEPTSDRPSAKQEPKFTRAKVHTPAEAHAKYHNAAVVSKRVKQYTNSVKPEHAKQIASAQDAFDNGKDTQAMHKKDGKYSSSRVAHHDKIISELFGDVKSSENPEVIYLGGIAGSGKSTVVNNHIPNKENYVVIDSDAVKKKLPEYDKNNAGSALMTHNESGDVVKRMIDKAITEKKNIIVDGTLKSFDKYERMAKEAKGRGFKTRLYATHLPTEKSIDRAMARYERTGRYVPPQLIEKMGEKINKHIHQFKNLVDDYKVFDTDVPFGQPVNRIEKVENGVDVPGYTDTYEKMIDTEEDSILAGFAGDKQMEKVESFTKQGLIDFMVKSGSNPKDAKTKVNSQWDYLQRNYKDATPKKAADVLRTIGKEKMKKSNLEKLHESVCPKKKSKLELLYESVTRKESVRKEAMSSSDKNKIKDIMKNASSIFGMEKDFKQAGFKARLTQTSAGYALIVGKGSSQVAIGTPSQFEPGEVEFKIGKYVMGDYGESFKESLVSLKFVDRDTAISARKALGNEVWSVQKKNFVSFQTEEDKQKAKKFLKNSGMKGLESVMNNQQSEKETALNITAPQEPEKIVKYRDQRAQVMFGKNFDKLTDDEKNQISDNPSKDGPREEAN